MNILHSLLEDEAVKQSEQLEISEYEHSDSSSSHHGEVSDSPSDSKHGNYYSNWYCYTNYNVPIVKD